MVESKNRSWEETVFEFRNKAYGAYLLRYNYPFRLTASALIVILAFVSVMVGLKISREQKEAQRQTRKVRVVNYSELSAPPPIEKIYVPPPPEPEPEEVVVQKVKVEKYVAPVVVQEEVAEPEEMMTMEEVKQDLASTDNTIEASDGEDIVLETVPVAQVVVSDVTLNPEFPGGRDAMNAWLASHLKYPKAAKRMGIEGNVVVAFTVDEGGKIMGGYIVESLHRLCDREAIRLVESMPDWTPGERNGRKSSVECSITVPFDLQADA
jgi:protein TonB